MRTPASAPVNTCDFSVSSVEQCGVEWPRQAYTGPGVVGSNESSTTVNIQTYTCQLHQGQECDFRGGWCCRFRVRCRVIQLQGQRVAAVLQSDPALY